MRRADTEEMKRAKAQLSGFSQMIGPGSRFGYQVATNPAFRPQGHVAPLPPVVPQPFPPVMRPMFGVFSGYWPGGETSRPYQPPAPFAAVPRPVGPWRSGQGPLGSVVYVRNLSFAVDENQLKSVFERFGHVVSIRVSSFACLCTC